MTFFQPSRLASYDDESLLSEVRRVVAVHFGGNTPRRRDFDAVARVHSGTLATRFGSWSMALKKAGIAARKAPVTREQILADLRRVRDTASGKYFSYAYYLKSEGRFTLKVMKSRFKCSGWAELLKMSLGVSQQKSPRRTRASPSPMTDDQLLDEMKRVWDFLGRRPSYGEFRQLAKFGPKRFETRFGGWRKAVEACAARFGLVMQGLKSSGATRGILLGELRAVSEDLGVRILPYRLYKKHGGTYSIGTFQAHFGSWHKAVSAAGLEDGHSKPEYSRKYSDEDLFGEIQKLWERFGNQPTSREMTQYGTIAVDTFKDRFGSWLKAIHAFCADRTESELTECRASATLAQGQRMTDGRPAKAQTLSQNRPHECAPPSMVMNTPRDPSVRLRFQVMQRDSFRCRICGRSPATHPGIQLEIDHVRPYSKGGETVLGNLQTLCKACNMGKSDLLQGGANA